VADTGCVLAYTNMLLAPVFDPTAGKVHARVCHDNLKDQWRSRPRIMTAHQGIDFPYQGRKFKRFSNVW
jgi:hypothetical protein